MDGLRVSELSEAAGVAASTVRFYERIGLLAPARRADNGYRVFDPSAVEELALINRAKGIGMSLEEISELVSDWPDTECRLLLARLRGFLVDRIDHVRAQRSELEAFEAQLQAVLVRLQRRDSGPERCGSGCGCESDLDLTAEPAEPAEPAESTRTSARLGTCSLDDDALARRILDWRAVAAGATSIEHDGDTVRLILPGRPDLVATAAHLSAAETSCCPTTRFVLEIGPARAVLTASGGDAPGLLETLFPTENCR